MFLQPFSAGASLHLWVGPLDRAHREQQFVTPRKDFRLKPAEKARVSGAPDESSEQNLRV